MQIHTSEAGHAGRDPETLVQHVAGTPSSWRYEIAPVDLIRSRKHGVMSMRPCVECGGAVIREDRGGPVLMHREHCSIPPRPRTWPKVPALSEPF